MLVQSGISDPLSQYSKNDIFSDGENWFLIVRDKFKQDRWVVIDRQDIGEVSRMKWRAQLSRNYWQIVATTKGSTVTLGQFLLKPMKGLIVDHANRDTYDNRRENLRVCTHAENMRNRKPLTGKKYKGIFKSRNKFVAQIRGRHIGIFNTEVEAAEAYRLTAAREYGEFAYERGV